MSNFLFNEKAIINASRLSKEMNIVPNSDIIASFSLTVLNKKDYSEKEINKLSSLFQEDENGTIIDAPGKYLIFPFEEYLYCLCEKIKKIINLGINKIIIKDINIPYFSKNKSKYSSAWLNKYGKPYIYSDGIDFAKKDYDLKMQLISNALKYIIYSAKGYATLENLTLSVYLEIENVLDASRKEKYVPLAELLKDIPNEGVVFKSDSIENSENTSDTLSRELLIKSIYNSVGVKQKTSKTENKYSLIAETFIKYSNKDVKPREPSADNEVLIIIPENIQIFICHELMIGNKSIITDVERNIIGLISFLLRKQIIPKIILENELCEINKSYSNIIVLYSLSFGNSYLLYSKFAHCKNIQIIIAKNENESDDYDYIPYFESKILPMSIFNERANENTKINGNNIRSEKNGKNIDYLNKIFNTTRIKQNEIIDITYNYIRTICNFTNKKLILNGMFSNIISGNYDVSHEVSIMENDCDIYFDIDKKINDDPTIIASNSEILDFKINKSSVTFTMVNQSDTIAKCRVFVPYSCSLFINKKRTSYELDEFKQSIFFTCESEKINQIKIVSNK